MPINRTMAISATIVAIGLLGASVLVVESASMNSSIRIPLSEMSYVLGDDISTYNGFMMSGGPPPDGIPSIDEPRFVTASEARLDPGDLVIGFHHEGEARAYPQKILAHHEIVNDRVGGLNVAITYCPLTATAQGFERGRTTLGVSGRLLNSNLVMYDRETGTLFSQIAATGLRGEDEGRTLVELNLVWTTWERWRARHPNTRVLSERTGHLRNYSRDPYGSYNPRGGYYRQAGTIFPLLHESGRHHDKEMVVGARTSDRSVYFVMADLAREGVLSTANFIAVYDPSLDTGYIYRTDGEAVDVRRVGDGAYELDGGRYRADQLPLERTVPLKAFFFAWHAFYPESEFPGPSRG
jgi:hypothetical protein